MALLPLLRELRNLEESLTIEDPTPVEEVRAYVIVPAQRETPGRSQCIFENHPIPTGDEGRLGAQAEFDESVRVRCHVYDADFDRACEIAVAFYDAFKRAINDERPYTRRLNNTFENIILRGDVGQTLQAFDGRPGWELTLDFTTFEVS